MVVSGIIKHERTDEARALCRLYGDKAVKFQNKRSFISSDPFSSTLSTVTKDNLLAVVYV